MDAVTNLIQNGLLKDLLISQRSYLLNKEIHEISKVKLTPIKTDISKILYDLTYTEMVLALCRLYDEPAKKYPTRCIKQLYMLIKDAEYKTEIADQALLGSQLQYLGFSPEFISLLEKSSIVDFNKRAVLFYQAEELNDPISSCLVTIKNIRNKLLAHNEDISINSWLPYETIEILLDHAKNVISFFSLAYSGVIIKVLDNFPLSQRAYAWRAMYKKFIGDENGG